MMNSRKRVKLVERCKKHSWFGVYSACPYCIAEQSLNETNRLRREKDTLLALVAAANIPCVYCGLEDISKCAHGFPGCSQADDLIMGQDEVFKRIAQERLNLQTEVKRLKETNENWHKRMSFVDTDYEASLAQIVELEQTVDKLMNYPGRVILTYEMIDAAWDLTYNDRSNGIYALGVKQALNKFHVFRCETCCDDTFLDGNQVKGPCPDCNGHRWVIGNRNE